MDNVEHERRILEFERAWRTGPVSLPECLAGVEPRSRRRLLLELICLDLEFRWRRAADAVPATARFILEDYIRDFPELGVLDDLPLELVGEEYRARRLWGDKPTSAEFHSRFTRRPDELAAILAAVEKEARDERAEPSAPTSQRPAGGPSSTTVADAPMPYGDFVLRRLIGAGRAGKVYRSWQRSLERQVAIKFLRKSFLSDPVAVARFVEEARIMANMRHSGIVGIHGLGRTPSDGLFMVMDLVDGPNLASVIRARKVSPGDAIRWTVDACSAIAHAHERGVVHCDLKPANLLLGPDNAVRLTDFGLARSLSTTTLGSGQLEGTAPFMAPEQVDAWWGAVDVRTDVYGLGAVLYALLTGTAPWPGRRLPDVLAQVACGAPVASPKSIRPEMPEALDHICRRCLAKPPAERYATASELRGALLALPPGE